MMTTGAIYLCVSLYLYGTHDDLVILKKSHGFIVSESPKYMAILEILCGSATYIDPFYKASKALLTLWGISSFRLKVNETTCRWCTPTNKQNCFGIFSFL